MKDPDVDARFAEIVAQWEAEARAAERDEPAADSARDGATTGTDGAGTDGAADDADRDLHGLDHAGAGESAEAAEPPDAAAPADEVAPPALPQPGASMTVWRGISREADGADGPDLVDDLEALDALPPAGDPDEEHFVPPDVELPPQEDLHYWSAVGGLVLGPVLLLWVVFARPFWSGWWLLGSFTLMIGGFMLLVLRQPKDRDEDDDGVRL